MPDPLFSVENQIVLVSGASRGIGRAIAVELARAQGAALKVVDVIPDFSWRG